MKKPFKKIYIEITNGCNLNCSFCQKSRRQIREMTSDEFEKIAKDIKKYTDYVCLHVKGEPLMHSALEDILKVCEKYGLMANITTNGTLLSEKYKILASHKAVRQINISLHAEVKDPVSYFENTLSTAQRLAENGIYISFRLWNGGEGKNMLKKLMERFPQSYKKGGRTTLDNNIFLSLDEFWEWPDINRDIAAERGTCHGLRSHIAILSDGTVIPCCLDGEGAEKLGNVFEESFDSIFEKSILPLRKDMENRKLPLELCKRCTYREKFR